MWFLKDKYVRFDLKWSIKKKAQVYSAGAKYCDLCPTEKNIIMPADKNCTNIRSEILRKCPHIRKFTLGMVKPKHTTLSTNRWWRGLQHSFLYLNNMSCLKFKKTGVFELNSIRQLWINWFQNNCCGFIAAIVVNPPERKLTKRTSVQWCVPKIFIYTPKINIVHKVPKSDFQSEFLA